MPAREMSEGCLSLVVCRQQTVPKHARSSGAHSGVTPHESDQAPWPRRLDHDRNDCHCQRLFQCFSARLEGEYVLRSIAQSWPGHGARLARSGCERRAERPGDHGDRAGAFRTPRNRDATKSHRGDGEPRIAGAGQGDRLRSRRSRMESAGTRSGSDLRRAALRLSFLHGEQRDADGDLPNDPQFATKAANFPAAAYVPAGYVPPPGPAAANAIPQMGLHWTSTSASELNGQAFTSTFIYGSWDGRFIFLEPMITKAYLESHPNVTSPIAQPTTWAAAGYYPTTSTVKYDPTAKEYRIVLGGLTKRGN